jgi:transcriptional regulator with PAS, ATPase and Fis domain
MREDEAELLHRFRSEKTAAFPQAMNTATQMQATPAAAPVVRSEVMRKLFAMAGRVALHDAAVLVVGETGSGKEVVVKEIHRLSPRSSKALVEVNCAALPEHLMESELFGYEKGAFSGAESDKPGLFEMANGGTILLDEIGEMDIKFQAKLLRVLDGFAYYRLGGSRKLTVDVRVVAATNRDLEEQIREGKFRKDLYYRLSQFQLHVPPLRERPEDVAALAEHFLQPHLPGAILSPEALEALQRYQWPGNVRELKNVMFKAALQAKPGTNEIRASDLPAAIYTNAEVSAPSGGKPKLADTEKRMIMDALSRCGGKQEDAARQLGISARTIRRKLEKYKKEESDSASGLGGLSNFQQRYFRVNIELPVILKVKGQSIDATTVNISSGGLAVRASSPLPRGAQPDISFHLPDVSSAIECPSRLAWAGPDGLIGLKFMDMHPALERELHRWLMEKARAEGWDDISNG